MIARVMKMVNLAEIKNQLRVNLILYISPLIGITLIPIILLLVFQNKDPETEKLFDSIFIIALLIIGLLIMIFSRIIYNRRISGFDLGTDLLAKITNYRTSKIIVWAMIEGTCIFTLVITMFSSHYIYIVVFIFLVGYYILLRPTRESLINDMRLNSEESDLILRA